MTSQPRFLAVVNPAAGGGACGRHAVATIDRLRQSGLEVDVFETRAAGDARVRAREELAAGRRDFIAVGGDGTSFEIVNGLLDQPIPGARPSLGFLPLGTGNSFLRDFSDQGAEYAIEALIQGKRRPCDVIRVSTTGGSTGTLHYINIFSIGFVADVGATRNRHFSGLGEFGYTLGTVLRVAGLHSYVFPMTIAGRSGEDREPLTFLSVNNSRFTGGKMMMAPDANTRDGLLDIIRVGRMGRIALLRTFPKIFKGTHVQHPAVSCFQAPAVDFRLGDAVDVMIDGEMMKFNPTRLEVVPGAIDVRT
ncbi:MAG: YegS/Rv2252/BmrU family lipid kinase [Nannocystis sp.]|uniref:diacylglycerol/lipid kinase family protein n=1 Tax=Nannocystis sp. TaxID=1962667 RepID=UPI002426C4BA|nr:YegS/Rv2252/BmrU family lipid kinase [Nannocystis sp.]MBK9757306.1 YegS/Rv2252/BmrU family lipid kinase [Nannocystis sp.]